MKSGIDLLSDYSIDVKVLCEEEGALDRDFNRNGADCTDYVKPDGKVGRLGAVIVNHIEDMGDNAYFYRNDLKSMDTLCPNWPRLSKEQKAYFWLWFMAAISWKETTCGATTVNKAATHGVAVGHLQLNKNRKDRSWRGGSSGNSCAAPDIANDVNNLKCGLEILNEQLKGRDGIYEGSGELFGRRANSYWQALRTSDGGKVIDLVQDFPFCK